MKDATQQGVLDERAEIYAKAEKSRLADLQEDGVEATIPPEDWEEDPEEPKAEETPQEEVEASPEEPTPEPQPTPEPTMRLKVDGVEVERPVSWVQAQAQKLAAADKRLEEASKAKTLYESRLAEIESSKPPEQKKPSLPADIADALKVLTRKQLATTDEGEFAELEAEKVLVYQEAARREWVAQQEASQLAEQQRQLKASVETLVKKVQEVHPDVLDVARTEPFHQWLGGQSAMVKWAWDNSGDPQDGIEIMNRYKAATNPAPSLETKREEKRKMDTVPAASARAVRAEPKEEDDSPSAVIKKIQQERSAIRGRVSL